VWGKGDGRRGKGEGGGGVGSVRRGEGAMAVRREDGRSEGGSGGAWKTVTHEGQPKTAWNVKQRVLDCSQTVFIGVMSANMVIWSWG